MTTAIVSGLIGLLGVLLGIYLNERYRQRNRIEFYSQKIFEKRLEAYEMAYNTINDCLNRILELIRDRTIDPKTRALETTEIMANFSNLFAQNAFYLDSSLLGGTLAIFLEGFEIANVDDIDTKDKEFKNFSKNRKKILETILKESGAFEINKHFKVISKSPNELESNQIFMDFLNKKIAALKIDSPLFAKK